MGVSSVRPNQKFLPEAGISLIRPFKSKYITRRKLTYIVRIIYDIIKIQRKRLQKLPEVFTCALQD